MIRAEDDGTVVAVWQDYRNIQCNIYMQYYKDTGRRGRKRTSRLKSRANLIPRFFNIRTTSLKSRTNTIFGSQVRSDALGRNADLLFD